MWECTLVYSELQPQYEPTIMATNRTKCFTSADLKLALGDASRNNKKLIQLAKHLKLSIHMVQSVALGRRNFRDDATWAKAQAWCNRD